MAEFIIQLLFEVFFEFFSGILIRLFLDGPRSFPAGHKSLTNLPTAVMLFVVGAFIGWASLWIFPRAFVRSESLHGISLLITPVLAGLAMVGFGWLRQGRGKPVFRLGNFGFGYIVALGIALMRFYFTE